MTAAGLAQGVVFHPEVVQGSDEWASLRLGLLTASEMCLIITPTLKVADNEKTRAHIYELLAQRITGYVEPRYVSDDMIRGHDDEIEARDLYGKTRAPVTTCGFVTNDKFGFTIGYSPDGVVGDDGLIECKSRRQKFQVQTIIEGAAPSDYMLQLQTGLLVSERKWIDFVSYSGGLPMATYRVLPNAEMQEAILNAATLFEQRLAEKWDDYRANLERFKFPMTERKIEQEMFCS